MSAGKVPGLADGLVEQLSEHYDMAQRGLAETWALFQMEIGAGELSKLADEEPEGLSAGMREYE